MHEDSAETGGEGGGVLDKRHEEGKRVLGEREKLTEGAGEKEEKEKRSARGDGRAMDADLRKTQEEEAEKGED